MANDTLIQSTTLTAIADAIRAKDGSTAQMYPSEMAEKIAGISTGIEIPSTISAGRTAICFIPCRTIYRYGISGEALGITIKRAGTYRFTVFAEGGYRGGIYLYKNGSQVALFPQYDSSSGYSGASYIDQQCSEGDRISLYANAYNGSTASMVIDIYGFLVSLQWDITEFTKLSLVSDKQEGRFSGAKGLTGIYINIPKTATYKFHYKVRRMNTSGNWSAKLYKNGSLINGTAISAWQSNNGIYVGDISCNEGDRIEIYVTAPSDDKIYVYSLFADEI